MTERAHEAFVGLTGDHLYETCPALARTHTDTVSHVLIGTRCVGTVDPLGSDSCGWCVNVWAARHRDEYDAFIDEERVEDRREFGG